jgi:pyruvate, orthophosphate dikinase
VSLVYALDHRFELPQAEVAALIGGKAAGLALMTNELGLPVPPGFAITTEACMAFLSGGWPAGLDEQIAAAMQRLEDAAGRRFGDAQDPLLVSVRSGAPVSMPGMMDTILNVGLNQETEQGLAAVSSDPAFAADSRRRLVGMFTKIVGAQTVPADPWRQLRAAVEAVFRSWNSERARAYRSREGIRDDLGTAVTVQAMVFGNRGGDSATGVVFTRNPATGEPDLYGDVLFASQGEDVVAGTHRTEPVAVLDKKLPEVARELRADARLLERHFTDMCDIEFTIERGKLWLLQVRVGKRSPAAALRIAVEMAEAGDFPLSRAQAVERVARYLTHPPRISTGIRNGVPALAVGLPASPGVATGEIATTPATAIAANRAGRSVILVRSETSPDDVPGMARSAGVLTTRGGLASHAAVVARGWGIPAVVGAEDVNLTDEGIDVGGRPLKVGETITIDGGTGEIFSGVVAGSTTVSPEAATLRRWAEDLGIEIVAVDDPPLVGDAPVTADEIIRTLVIKGTSTPDAVAAALLSSPEAVAPAVKGLVADSLLEPDGDAYRLTATGKVRGAALIETDRVAWGSARWQVALTAFHELDLRVKEVVTGWQLRDVGGSQVLNDHADSVYDGAVLGRLADLHHDALMWLTSLNEGPGIPTLSGGRPWPQATAGRGVPAALIRYGMRLARALASANAGDQRFVASPRVDSYHSIWFELHEELILLAGRSRAEEAAEGRA